MPLASSGAWTSIGRQASHIIQAPNIGRSRGLHTRLPQPSTTQRLLKQTTGLFKAFVGHLTTPGTLRQPASAGRALHAAATRGPTIQSGLSLSARQALARPFGAPRLPRPPVVPRSIAQVGLGTARNFSTGRPIFQSLADNVPIAGRAFVEADWELRVKEERKQIARGAKKAEKAKAKTAVRAEEVHFHPAASAADKENEAELEHYFPAPPTPAVSTTLLVPLAPTPTSRIPLSPTAPSASAHPLLPFVELSALRYDHAQHSQRVSALFARLDAASVWDAGAQCDVHGDPRGASVLRVRFVGWEANAVRGIIGESGSGWCILEEERAEAQQQAESEVEDVLEYLSSSGVSDFSHAFGEQDTDIDPAQSFVLPTLDFSAAFVQSPMVSRSASWESFSDMTSEPSDGGVEVDMFTGRPASVTSASERWTEVSSSAGTWLGFSSAFEQRMEEGPREVVF
ncbi:hypothetical protein FA95DRAFT_1559488 [Auriscalpium vulgare]|uniref:Uncharacterized protein n=1 Tax=Auriscalpium vulgare TaxID=40419 RepID=A0ACB8RSQ7_9AGAM|nr:hypothetical protein FA95DRAFT_1559488 [Auriscalpium vulgare]